MRDSRFKFGVVATALWIAIMIWFALRDPAAANAMKPNEWGDFFSGLFAPIAFLWLVLGYLQQGEELGLSSKALQMQAEELRHSVEQQRELVEVSRQQVLGEREALEEERRIRVDAAKPYFVFKNDGGAFGGNGNSKYNVVVANSGNTATEVVATFNELVQGRRTIIDHAMFSRAQECRTAFEVTAPLPGAGVELVVTYRDNEGRPGRAIYKVRKQDDSPNSMLLFERIEGSQETPSK